VEVADLLVKEMATDHVGSRLQPSEARGECDWLDHDDAAVRVTGTRRRAGTEPEEEDRERDDYSKFGAELHGIPPGM
jgi:hypothetical protein